MLCVDTVTCIGRSNLNEFGRPTFPFGEGLVKFHEDLTEIEGFGENVTDKWTNGQTNKCQIYIRIDKIVEILYWRVAKVFFPSGQTLKESLYNLAVVCLFVCPFVCLSICLFIFLTDHGSAK